MLVGEIDRKKAAATRNGEEVRKINGTGRGEGEEKIGGDRWKKLPATALGQMQGSECRNHSIREILPCIKGSKISRGEGSCHFSRGNHLLKQQLASSDEEAGWRAGLWPQPRRAVGGSAAEAADCVRCEAAEPDPDVRCRGEAEGEKIGIGRRGAPRRSERSERARCTEWERR